MKNEDIIRAWAEAADRVGEVDDEGDFAHKHLLNPTIFALLGDVGGQRILDAGCGQGYLCRLLARQGALVTDIEPAEPWYRYAVEREQRERLGLGIDYLQADLAMVSFQALAPFDSIVANMVLMDIPAFEAAMASCVALLRPGGNLIFSLVHPCFEEESSEWEKKGFVAVPDYLHEYTIPQTIGLRFHRPLSRYLNLTIQLGCILRQIIEPQLAPQWAERGSWHARNVNVPSFIVIQATKA